MVITSLAGTISMGTSVFARCDSCDLIALGWPTKRIFTPYSCAANTLPSTSGRGAWSPPMASTAIVIMEILPMLQERSKRPTPETGTIAQAACFLCVNHAGHAAERRFKKGLLHRLDWTTLVITTVGACLMRLLGFMAVGAFCQSGASQKIVGPSLVFPHFGMSTLWIRHCSTPRSGLSRQRWLRSRSNSRGFGPGNLQTN